MAPKPPDFGQAVDSWLISVLIDAGLLLPVQVEELRSAGSTSVWEHVVSRAYLRDEQIVETLAKAFKVKIADIGSADPRSSTLLPESIARKHRLVPLAADDRSITIATSDPHDLGLEQTLSFVTGRNVVLQVAAPKDIDLKVDEFYRPEKSINRLLEGLEPSRLETVDERPSMDPERDPALDAPMTRLVDAMISDGVREGASDIHAEPLSDGTSVRYRIDGVLREVMRLPVSAGPALVRRVKILSKLDVTDPLHPHDGRAAVRVDGKYVDLRVSTVPVARRGEKVVIRILDKSNLRANIPDLNLPENEEHSFRQFLENREGMILVTGPTGSGKTTTLYAVINELRTGKVNIVTVEDPVEYDIPGISQLQVNEAQQFTFANALRSVLRQDPDILLVGEIRDRETAEIAVQAGLTGHLVFSTLHTNDAASAVVRLRDLGVDGFKIAAVLKGIVAQRLVRKVCPHCSLPVALDDLPVEARPPKDRASTAVPRRSVGCKQCGGTGYRGRMSVLEMLPIHESVAKKIEQGALPDAIMAAARPLGFRTLWESALERVWTGQTTLEEAVRVLGEHTGEDPSAGAPEPGFVPIVSQVPAPVTAAMEPVTREAGKTRILIADDDRQMRRLVRGLLEREGHEVTEASDGLDALDAIESGQFDLMVLDIDMPRLDGLGVLEELRARVMTSGVPVIVLTARTDDTEAQVLDLGAQDYLTKPVQPQSLLSRVRAVLRRARMS
jgi:type II secretory ATPase GspE/PulE/Tfp pilus assembly ATPase PilB-like protein/ActR/RegA family two-component response regulator